MKMEGTLGLAHPALAEGARSGNAIRRPRGAPPDHNCPPYISRHAILAHLQAVQPFNMLRTQTGNTSERLNNIVHARHMQKPSHTIQH